LATNTLVRAKFESELAACVLMESDIATDPAQQRAMSEQAIKLLQSSAAIQGADMPALLYDLWGVTLIKLGKLDNDPAKFQEAIERLHTCLTKEPGRLAARYNLACVYALIGRPDLAMTHLAVCIDGDPSRRFREAARKDPDLASVRNLPEFISLVAQPDSKVAIPLAKPGISNR
jgi:tetratricopeptide (TPR) repeat protein